MPKRTSEEKINYYNAKIKILQERQLNKKQRPRRRVIIYSSSDSENNLDDGTRYDNHDNTPPPLLNHEVRDKSPSPTPEPRVLDDSQTKPSGNDSRSASPAPEPQPQESIELQGDSEPIDSDLLEALGDATEDAPVYGPEIHSTLAQRWLPILKKGLKSELKDKLLKDYTVPENCKLLKAPTVNAELKAAVSETARNRDKKIQDEQDQLGLGITAINRAITVLLTQDNKVEAVRILSDGCRILTDLHFNQTQVRKKLITRGLDKAFLTCVQDQERDETLFGTTLPEKIKESKAIEKQGKEIKKTPLTKASTSSASSQPVVTRSRFQGNWPAPPRYPPASRGARSSQYRSQYQYRGTPTLAPPAFPAPSTSQQASRPSTSTATGSRRAPARH